MPLPDCMMPDGEPPCAGFNDVQREIAEITAQRDLYERALRSIQIKASETWRYTRQQCSETLVWIDDAARLALRGSNPEGT